LDKDFINPLLLVMSQALQVLDRSLALEAKKNP
jgi:hypothetical protein